MQLAPHTVHAQTESPWKQLTSGVQYVSRQLDLAGLILLALVFSIFGISYSTVLPAFVEQVLKLGAAAYGWVNALTGVGAVVGAFLIANQHGLKWRGKWLWGSSIGFPLVLILFAFNQFFPFSLVLALGLGVGFMVQFTLINTLLQTRVDDRLRGRVMGLYTLTFFGFAPFGNLGVGALAEHLGLSLAMTIFAGTGLLLSLLVYLRIPQVRELA